MPSEYELKRIQYIFMDVVGFTRGRAVENQVEIISTFNKLVTHALNYYNVDVNDRILLHTGDGLCIALTNLEAYPSPYDLNIRITLNILRKLHQYNEHQKTIANRFEMRIGINESSSEIILFDINNRKNCAGLGINTAQRIMSNADGNQIFLGEYSFNTLNSTTKYAGMFNRYNTSDKHKNKFPVYQYIDKSKEYLNINIPKRFFQVTKPKKLSILQAYYLAYCLKFNEPLASVKTLQKHKTAAFWLLYNLATDEVREKRSVGEPIIHLTVQVEHSNFTDVFSAYLAKMDDNIQDLAYKASMNTLSNIAYCFKTGESLGRNFIIVDDVGKQKLLEEYPEIYKEFGIQ